MGFTSTPICADAPIAVDQFVGLLPVKSQVTFPLTLHMRRDSGAQAQGDGEDQRSHPLARDGHVRLPRLYGDASEAMEQNKNKKFSLLRSRCAAGFAPGAVVVRPLGDIVLLCDGSRRDALASRVVPCRNKWTMRAKSLPPPPLLLLLLLPPSSLPAPTAVVRCVAESDVCARRSRTTAVKSAGVREAITSCPDFQNKTRHLIPPPFKLCHIRFFRKVKAYLNSWCFVMRYDFTSHHCAQLKLQCNRCEGRDM